MSADVILRDVNQVYPNGFHAVYDFNIEIEKFKTVQDFVNEGKIKIYLSFI